LNRGVREPHWRSEHSGNPGGLDWGPGQTGTAGGDVSVTCAGGSDQATTRASSWFTRDRSS